MTLPQRNTNTSEEVVIEERGGRGRDLGPMTGTERGSVATRANTTAVVGTQDTAVTGAETHSHTETHTHTDRRALGLIVTKVFSLYLKLNQMWRVP